jgi:hypothetical protein
MPNIHLPKTCAATLVAGKTRFLVPPLSLLENNYLYNTSSNHAKFVINKLAFCQLLVLMQK